MWSVEYFRWKLGPTNPAGPGYISIAVMEDRVVGTVSLTKKRLLINGTECIGGEVGDSYSSAAVRRRSRPIDLSPLDPDPESYINKSIFGRLASDVRARAERDGITLIYGTPNKNAYPGWIDRLGYFDLKNYRLRSFSRPTSKILARRYPSLTFLVPFLHGVDMSCVALHKLAYCRSRKFAIVSQVPAPDELDDLWLRLKSPHGFCLVRDASYWRHRYIEHPLAKYEFLCIRDRNRLVGVVVTRFSSIADGRRVVAIAEWMNQENVPFGYVLSAILERYNASGAEVFNFWAQESSEEARAAVWSLFGSRHRTPIIFADTPQARSVRTTAKSMKFYLGSSDAV